MSFPSSGGVVFFDLSGGEWLLGRGAGCQLSLDDLESEARVAALVVSPAGAKLRPLDGASLTVDGAPVTGEVSLAVGQKLTVAGSGCQLSLVDLPDDELTRLHPNTVKKADIGEPDFRGQQAASVLWSQPVASHPFVQLAAATDRVVVGGDKVIAFAADTGAVAWEEDAGSFAGLAIAGDLVIYQQFKRKIGLCRLTACELLTGKKRWQLRVDGAILEMLDSGEGSLLFTSTRQGPGDLVQVSSVDLATGQVRWTTSAKKVEAHLRAVAGGRALLTLRRALLALDLSTGAEVWNVASERVHPDDRLAALGDLFFVGTPSRLQARRVADGGVQWETQGPGYPEGRPALITSPGRVHLVFDEGLVGIQAAVASDAGAPPPEGADLSAGKVGGQVLTWSAASGRLLWHLDVRQSDASYRPHRPCRALVADGDRLVLALDDRLQSIADGGHLWREYSFEGRHDSGLCVLDGRVYFLASPSTLVAVRLGD